LRTLCNAKEDFNLEIEPESIKFSYDIYFKDKKLCLPKLQHERPIKDTQIIHITDDNGISKPVERIEYTTCRECGYPLVTLDRHRSERICECGMTNKRIIMISDYELDSQHSPEPVHTKETSLTYDEKRFLKSKRRKGLKTRTSMQDYRKSQYILTFKIISSQLFMTEPQKDRVKNVINDHSLQLIHSRVNHKIIIACICRYILLQYGRGRGNELRFNITAFKFIGLDSSNYNIIERNLKRLGI